MRFIKMNDYNHTLGQLLNTEENSFKFKIALILDKIGLFKYQISRCLFFITDKRIERISSQIFDQNVLGPQEALNNIYSRWKISYSLLPDPEIGRVTSSILSLSVIENSFINGTQSILHETETDNESVLLFSNISVIENSFINGTQSILHETETDNEIELNQDNIQINYSKIYTLDELDYIEINLNQIKQEEKVWLILKEQIDRYPNLTQIKIKGIENVLSRYVVEQLFNTEEPSIEELKREIILKFEDSSEFALNGFHRHLLIEKSTYFNSLWSGNFKESQTNSVDIKEIKSDSFINLFSYLFGHSITNFEINTILDLIAHAKFCGIEEIIDRLEDQLIDQIKDISYYQIKNISYYELEENKLDIDNLIELFEHFELLQLPKLYTYLQSYINNLLIVSILDLNIFNNIIDQLNSKSKNNSLSSYLVTLNFSSVDRIDNNCLLALSRLNLKELNLSQCHQITDNGLVHLKSLTQLKHLDLSQCHQITDNGLVHLASLNQLQILYLNWCKKITDAGLAHLTTLTQLKHLDLSQCHQITDNGLVHLASLNQLQILYLNWCKKITDAGLAHLTTLTQLKYLDLSQCNQITDAGLAHLTTLTQLKYLDLSQCNQITDAGLAHLTTLTQLKYLDLSRCHQITDVGLAYLTALTQLKHLITKGCNKLD
jgi:F-box and leucine-rich repeat protein 14